MLLSGVQGITDLITTPGLINLDFADVKSVMQGAGSALMGIGSARGEDRAIQAAELAISSPLLEASIDGAHGVLLSIQGGSDLGLFEINEAARLVQEAAHPEANIIFGAVIDDALGDEVRVTVIAAGFDGGAPHPAPTTGALGQPSRAGPAPGAARPRAPRTGAGTPGRRRRRPSGHESTTSAAATSRPSVTEHAEAQRRAGRAPQQPAAAAHGHLRRGRRPRRPRLPQVAARAAPVAGRSVLARPAASTVSGVSAGTSRSRRPPRLHRPRGRGEHRPLRRPEPRRARRRRPGRRVRATGRGSPHGPARPVVFMDQVHGADGRPSSTASTATAPPSADALVTARRRGGRSGCSSPTACRCSWPTPARGRRAPRTPAGAGWPPGVVPARPSTSMRELGAARGRSAVVGPVGRAARCYEVPAEMRDEARGRAPVSAHGRPGGTPALDLAAGVVAQLRARRRRDVALCAGCTRRGRRPLLLPARRRHRPLRRRRRRRGRDARPSEDAADRRAELGRRPRPGRGPHRGAACEAAGRDAASSPSSW